MKNAFARAGRKCVWTILASGLSAMAMFAASFNAVIISIPHSISVGSQVLPEGNYTMTSLTMASGDQMIVLRSENSSPVTLQAHCFLAAEASDTTKVEFSTSGSAWQLRRLFIEGESTGYEFVNTVQREN